MAARYTAIALCWDEIGLQSLVDHMAANHFFLEALKSASRRLRAWICYANETRIFLQENLKLDCSGRGNNHG